MTFDNLVKTAKERKTLLCFGVDPDLSKIGSKDPSDIAPFFHDIITKLLNENAIASIKPNYAFFAQYGFEGLYALEDIMQHYRGKVQIILDGKRGDIGKTGEAYSRELYEFWGADAVTVSPYMGTDSVAPFVRPDKLAYVLCKTSNPGANDFQEIESKVHGEKLYEAVAKKSLEWVKLGGCGLVVGATSDSIKKIVKITEGCVPFLIPGIGTQGGDLDMVMKSISGNPFIHRINASSSISYAFSKNGGKSAEAALSEAAKLNEQIRRYL